MHMSKETSESVGRENNVSIASLFSSIHVFHEVMCDEYPGAVQDHPHIELHSDGSGSVMSRRTRTYSNKEKYPNGLLFTFRNLNELVAEADRLMKKHGVQLK